jgi:Putative zinc- or iron-chelating domain
MTERLDRNTRRQILKEDQQWIGKVLDIDGGMLSVKANTRHLALMLMDTKLRNRASRAAAFASQLLDATIAKKITAPAACSKGCHYCCKTYISVTIPEIFYLAKSVRGNGEKTARAVKAAAESGLISQEQREITRVFCPILEDKSCSEYLTRPIVCRAVLSKSLGTCLRVFEGNSGEPFPFLDNTTDIRVTVVVMMQSALILSGLPHAHYEMNQALAVALAHNDAEECWLKGEPMFSAVPIDAADLRPSSLSSMMQALVENIRPTL